MKSLSKTSEQDYSEATCQMEYQPGTVSTTARVWISWRKVYAITITITGWVLSDKPSLPGINMDICEKNIECCTPACVRIVTYDSSATLTIQAEYVDLTKSATLFRHIVWYKSYWGLNIPWMGWTFLLVLMSIPRQTKRSCLAFQIGNYNGEWA